MATPNGAPTGRRTSRERPGTRGTTDHDPSDHGASDHGTAARPDSRAREGGSSLARSPDGHRPGTSGPSGTPGTSETPSGDTPGGEERSPSDTPDGPADDG